MLGPCVVLSHLAPPVPAGDLRRMSDTSRYQRFFAELKRRRVFRVAAMYGATAFVVLQVADLFQEGLELPQVFLRVVTVLSLLGFPVALVLAWAYERTPAGVRRTDPAQTGEIEEIVASAPAKRWPIGLAAAAGTALLLVGGWWGLGSPAAPGGGAAPGDGQAASESTGAGYSSIAVLPFVNVNMSGDPADEYFSDGLSEELLNVLAQIEGLKVAARTSSFAFKGRELDIREIGETLGVETILEGSVRRGADGLRITDRRRRRFSRVVRDVRSGVRGRPHPAGRDRGLRGGGAAASAAGRARERPGPRRNR